MVLQDLHLEFQKKLTMHLLSHLQGQTSTKGKLSYGLEFLP